MNTPHPQIHHKKTETLKFQKKKYLKLRFLFHISKTSIDTLWLRSNCLHTHTMYPAYIGKYFPWNDVSAVVSGIYIYSILLVVR